VSSGLVRFFPSLFCQVSHPELLLPSVGLKLLEGENRETQPRSNRKDIPRPSPLKPLPHALGSQTASTHGTAPLFHTSSGRAANSVST